MIKRLLLLCLFLGIILFASGCTTGPEIEFSGFVDFSMKSTVYDVNDPILVKFYYGQDYSENYDFENLIGHKIEVYQTTSLGGYTSSLDEWIMLYEKDYEKSEFIDDKYKCEVGGFSFFGNINVKYKAGFDLNIDFSNIPFKKGNLVIRITEDKYVIDLINGEEVYREISRYYQKSLYFKIEDEKVKFSWREFK